MKKTIIIYFGVMQLAIVCGLIGCNGPKKHTDTDATQFLKQFYTAYITAGYKILDGDGLKQQDSLYRLFCTPRMKKQQSNPDIDWDLILNAQNFQLESIQTLSITKSDTEGVYTVKYNWKNDYGKTHTIDTITIRLKVVNENGAYKIDSVLR